MKSCAMAVASTTMSSCSHGERICLHALLFDHIAHATIARSVIQFGAWSPTFTTWGNGGSNNDLWAMPEPYLSAARAQVS